MGVYLASRYWKEILITGVFLSFLALFFFIAILGGYEQQQQNSSCGSPGIPLSISGNTNLEKAWNYFSQYYSKTSTAGILGNLMVESAGTMDPSITQRGGGPGIGLAQWSIDGRWLDLVRYATTEGQNPFSLEVQLSFINVEMRSNNYGVYGDAFNTKSIDDSALYFEQEYEIAGKPNMTDRNNYAHQIFTQFAGITSVTTGAAQAIPVTQQCTGTGTLDGSTPPNVDGSEPWYSNVMNVALPFKGMPYYWGGNTPIPGFDCSGLWQYSFGQIGISLPRTAQQQFDFTTRISADQLKPGDFIFFSGTYQGPTITHVGLYVGNGYMYDSDNDGIGYHQLNGYWQSHLAGYGRLKQ